MFNFNEDQFSKHLNTVKDSVLSALTEARYLSAAEKEDLNKRLVVALTKEKWFSPDKKHQSDNNYQIDVMFRQQFPANLESAGEEEETND